MQSVHAKQIHNDKPGQPAKDAETAARFAWKQIVRDASPGCRIVCVGGLHVVLVQSYTKEETDCLCVVVVMRLSAQL